MRYFVQSNLFSPDNRLFGDFAGNHPGISCHFRSGRYENRRIQSDQGAYLNASSPVMFSATGRLNVLLNGKGAAQLDIWEYIELLVPRGRYRVDLVHHDVGSFSSSHEVNLDAPGAYLEVKATIASNSARVVSELPADFKEMYYKK